MLVYGRSARQRDGSVYSNAASQDQDIFSEGQILALKTCASLPQTPLIWQMSTGITRWPSALQRLFLGTSFCTWSHHLGSTLWHSWKSHGGVGFPSPIAKAEKQLDSSQKARAALHIDLQLPIIPLTDLTRTQGSPHHPAASSCMCGNQDMCSHILPWHAVRHSWDSSPGLEIWKHFWVAPDIALGSYLRTE